jgi:hypothetical protein
MYVWTQFRGQNIAPSPLLSHLAGEFADRIARLWPHPHADFLTASTAQRHLTCLGLTLGVEEAAVRKALYLPLKRAVRLLVTERPDGLVRALHHMGETAWKAADYHRLLALLARTESAKLLRHAAVIDPDLVGSLAAFPPALLRAGLGELKLTAAQSALASEIWLAVEARDGPWVAAALAERLAKAKTVHAMFVTLREAMTEAIPPPPFVSGPRLRPIATREGFHEVAGRFNNCLRDQVETAAAGFFAFYEWSGTPGAVVQIRRDSLFGWTLEEVRLRDNQIMTAADRPALLEDLRTMGVHIGRPQWALHRDCWEALSLGYELEPIDQAVSHCFGD